MRFRNTNKRTAALAALPGLALLLVAVVLPDVAQAATEAVAPQFSVPIPGIQLRDIKTTGVTQIDIPWLAQYIAGVYRYAMYAAVLMASVMFVIGGFQYLTAGSSDRVNAGKKRITDAIVGVLLVLLSYTILNTINPALVAPAYLHIRLVEANREFPGSAAASEIVTGSDIIPINLTDADKDPSNTYVATTSSCANKSIPQDMRDAAIASEKITKVPAAVLLAQWSVESNNGAACIGTDKGTNKFNCWGVKCTDGGGGRDVPIVEGGTRPVCPAGCVSRKTKEFVGGQLTPYYSCFQVFDTFEEAAGRHAKAVQRNNWTEYADNPIGYAKFIGALRPPYATDPKYSASLIKRMRQNCLVEPLPTPGVSPTFMPPACAGVGC